MKKPQNKSIMFLLLTISSISNYGCAGDASCGEGLVQIDGRCVKDYDGDGFASLDSGGNDCNDSNSAINPSAAEICDGQIDNNCNGLSDDSDPETLSSSKFTYYLDSDGDGYGDPNTIAGACSDPSGYSKVKNHYTLISVGYYHTCGLTASGGVKCWGYNGSGALGDGTTTDSLIPVDVVTSAVDPTPLTGVKSISSGIEHTCALTELGKVYCWGYNYDGQLGNGESGDLANSSFPVSVLNLTEGASSISLGSNHTCTLTSLGGVKCWGYNFFGQSGDGSVVDFNPVPVEVKGLTSGVKKLFATKAENSCALTSSGDLKCWGFNGDGQIGDGTRTDRREPVDVVTLTDKITSLSSGSGHMCALTVSGGVKCWGDNRSGQLGDGTIISSLVPVDVVGLESNVISLFTGWNNNCVVTSSGEIKCWGDNYHGELGNGEIETNYLIPVKVGDVGSGTVSISLDDHSCYVTSSGLAKCSGYNYNGQLGNGLTEDSSVPVNVIW